MPKFSRVTVSVRKHSPYSRPYSPPDLSFLSFFFSLFPQRPRHPTCDYHDHHVRRGNCHGRSHTLVLRVLSHHSTFSHFLCYRRESCSLSYPCLVLPVFIIVHLSSRRSCIFCPRIRPISDPSRRITISTSSMYSQFHTVFPSLR